MIGRDTSVLAHPATDAAFLPAFAESRRVRLFLGSVLYLAQGLPQGVAFSAIPIWLAANGASTAEVGMAFSAASIPSIMKIGLGPIVDRYSWLPMGRRRPWICGAQILIVVLLASVVIMPISPDQYGLVVGFSFTLLLLTAFQDVALDALAADLTPEDEMGRMTSSMESGRIIGFICGMGMTSYMLEYHGFSLAMLAVLGCFLVPAISIVLVREHPGEKLLPGLTGRASQLSIEKAKNDWAVIFRLAFRALLRRQSFIVAIILLCLGLLQSIEGTLLNVFIGRELNWNQAQIGGLTTTVYVLDVVILLTIAGPIIDRFGPKRCIFWSGIAASLGWGTYLIEPALLLDDTRFIVWRVLTYLPTIFLFQSIFALVMRAGSATSVAGTVMATLFATNSLGNALGGVSGGALDALGGYDLMFAATGICLLCAGLMALMLDRASANLKMVG